MNSRVKALAKSLCPPRLWHLVAHARAARRLGDQATQRSELFWNLVRSSGGKRCLQIGARVEKYAPHWVCVDLYDTAPYVDFNYDIHDLKFSDSAFDVVVCNAVLEHVDDPQQAIRELRRVLVPGGVIWIEVPFIQKYHPAPLDHWRVTPSGIRLWMRAFEEIASGFFTANGSSLHSGCFFMGRKP
jgi:SAM-dependent methyltransferase